MATFSTDPLQSPLLRPRAMADERLARRVGEADEQAFTELYARHHQALYRYCRAILREDADAQDALQSTWTRALVALRNGRRDAPLRPWLYRIAHNESISVMRRRNRPADPVPDRLAPHASAEQQVIERERFAMLLADLRALSERPRGALIMRELNGLSHEEIASALETSVAGAKQSIYEARRELADFAQGRAADCDDICRRISDGDRRVLRGRSVRAHLRSCAACATFAEAIGVRGAGLNGMLPLLPAAAAAALLRAVLTAGVHGGGGAAVASAAGSTSAAAAGSATTTAATTTTGAGTGAAVLGVAGKGTGLALLAKAAAGVAVIGASVVAVAGAPGPGAASGSPLTGAGAHTAHLSAALTVLGAVAHGQRAGRADRGWMAGGPRSRHAGIQSDHGKRRMVATTGTPAVTTHGALGLARGRGRHSGTSHGRNGSATAANTSSAQAATAQRHAGPNGNAGSHGSARTHPVHPAHPSKAAASTATSTATTTGGPGVSVPAPGSAASAIAVGTAPGKSALAPGKSHQ